MTPINVGNGRPQSAAAPGAVWVANSLDATVWRIDPSTNRVIGTVTVGEGPKRGDRRTRRYWVSNALSGTLSKIDPATDTVVKSFPVGDEPQGVAAGANVAYVAVRGSTGIAHRGGH